MEAEEKVNYITKQDFMNQVGVIWMFIMLTLIAILSGNQVFQIIFRGSNRISRVGSDFADECNVPQSWRTLQWQSRCSRMSSGNESSRLSHPNRCTQASGDLEFPTAHVSRGFSSS